MDDRTLVSVPMIESEEVSQTRTSQELLSDAGHLRHVVRALASSAEGQLSEVQRHAMAHRLGERASEEAQRSVRELLADLSSLGFSWRDISRMVGVSVPALRKWRRGERASGPNRRAVAEVVAFIRLLQEEHGIEEVASWLEVPLHADCPLTGLDLYEAGRLDLLYERAGQLLSDAQALERFMPDWRDRYESRTEIFVDEDGAVGLRAR